MRFAAAMTGLMMLLTVGIVQAARESNVRATKHNFSAAPDGSIPSPPHPGTSAPVPTRTVKATNETEVCVFCHTPHAATTTDAGGAALVAPLWNRKVPAGSSYIAYTSSTLDAQYITNSLSSQPGGSSKLCLSCHDGTLAIGEVNVLRGAGSATTAGTITIPMTTPGVKMPGDNTTGFTRNLGVNLTNDHPISVTYDKALADRDGELRSLDDNQKYPATTGTIIGKRSSGYKPKLPLESTGNADAGQVQCATCHDPHIREASSAKLDYGREKFLRLNRFQELAPTGTYSEANDIICLSCHDKDKLGTSWAFSAHANSTVADELYSNTHSDRREFPRDLPVWKAACLNCHDTHSVQGSRRLLREGTDEGVSTALAPKPGGTGKAALEETCYQCHDGGTNGTLQSATNVPNIKNDFTGTNKRMPITTAAQGTSGGGGTNTSEPHDISSNFNDTYIDSSIDCTQPTSKCGKDLMEPRSKLGLNNLNNRHAECTDCHNPHRVIRGKNGLPGVLTSGISGNTSEARVNGASGGAHAHTTGTTHTNRISGVLRGSWGIEPGYPNASFYSVPDSFAVKRGDPVSASHTDCANGANKTACDSAGYVTREYQICLKCHSNYGYNDNNVYPSDTANGRPSLGGTNLTAKDISRTALSYTTYTNQAREFQAPSLHRANATRTDSGASINTGSNRRSWHPVMDSTGRTTTLRGSINSSNWEEPWNNAVGTQTMYCSDCHGSDNGTATTVIPTTTSPWGPHGSKNNFLLKGVWTTETGDEPTAETGNQICFKCHKSTVYKGDGTRTGFWVGNRGKGIGKDQDGHDIHNKKTGGIRCNWCHVAVPHGWKNKALLVNLNDVGAEAGVASGTVIANAAIKGVGYSNGPYYRNAMLKVDNWAASGNWNVGDCGPVGANEDQARSWMNDSSNNTCKNPP